MIYLDYAATTPMRKEVLAVLQEANKEYFGNASSLHDIGRLAADALQMCRQQLAASIGGEEEGVYFTSGGSESNHLAIRSLLDGNRHQGKHLITTEVEHASVYHLFQQLEKEGYSVTYLPVDAKGKISISDLKAALRSDTILASIHHGNSEIGTIQTIAEIGELLHRQQVLFHTDTVQSFGKVPLDVKEYHIDSLSVSSHKIYGPKGVGMCYLNPRVSWKSQYPGTTHERGFRPGTVNVPGIIAFTVAAEKMIEEMEEERKKAIQGRKQFLADLPPTIQVEGHDDMDHQLPHIIGLSFLQAQGQSIMLECNRYGIAISTGSACQVGRQEPSRTMQSMGKTREEANQFVRLSFGMMTTAEELQEVIQRFKQW